jgi:hypothetical protein
MRKTRPVDLVKETKLFEQKRKCYKMLLSMAETTSLLNWNFIRQVGLYRNCIYTQKPNCVCVCVCVCVW